MKQIKTAEQEFQELKNALANVRKVVIMAIIELLQSLGLYKED